MCTNSTTSTLAPENGKTEDDCRMTMTMTMTMQGTLTKTDQEYRSDGNDYSHIYKTTVTWGSPKIAKGFADKGSGT